MLMELKCLLRLIRRKTLIFKNCISCLTNNTTHMNRKLLVILLLSMIWLIMAKFYYANLNSNPVRTSGIPLNAVWVGGNDGGIWVSCSKQDNIGSTYKCLIYNEYTGELESCGSYKLLKCKWSDVDGKVSYVQLGSVPAKMVLDSFDGVVIYASGNLALVPDGLILYPFGDGHGKKRIYTNGILISAEITY